jgi:hypothetical protein
MNGWILVLIFHMGHMPVAPQGLVGGDSVQVVAHSTGYDSKKACELAGSLITKYFTARESPEQPNGDGRIEFHCDHK